MEKEESVELDSKKGSKEMGSEKEKNLKTEIQRMRIYKIGKFLRN